MNWLLNLLGVPKVSVQNYDGMGRGIRADRNFKEGDIIEETPVVIIDRQENHDINDCILNLYRFAWVDSHESCLAMGIGSLFNHSFEHNVTYACDPLNKTMVFKAKGDIKKGQQLFINYGYEPVSQWKNYLRKKDNRREREEIELMNRKEIPTIGHYHGTDEKKAKPKKRRRKAA